MELRGRVAIVTGGGSGIGRALALALAGEGCDVAIADVDGESAEAVAAEVREHGRRAIGVRADVTSDDDVEALRDRTLAELGGAHVVCANAGVLLLTPLRELAAVDWQWLFDVDVVGAARTVHAFLPHLLEQGEGHLVLTSSVTAIAGGGAYGATKAALLHLGEALHEELAGDGVGTTILLPSHVSSRIASSQRNRPANYGRRLPEPFADVTGFGIDPSHVGRRAVDAIQAGELLVPVFPDGNQQRFVAPLRARAEALQEAAAKGGVRP